MPTTAATVEKEAPAHPWMNWTGQDSVTLLQTPHDIQKKNYLVQSVSKFAFFDFLTHRCCQVHDQCYSDAMQHPECWPILDNPYTELYDYSCDEKNKKVTCGSEYNLKQLDRREQLDHLDDKNCYRYIQIDTLLQFL